LPPFVMSFRTSLNHLALGRPVLFFSSNLVMSWEIRCYMLFTLNCLSFWISHRTWKIVFSSLYEY
jgi:hypothetical protein